MRRHTTTILLWTLAVCGLAVLVVRGAPWIWPQLFPADANEVAESAEEAPSPEYVSEVLSRFLAGWGEHLPSDEDVIELPPGRRPQELEAGLRREPRLGGLEVYVTQSDELHHSLRVFSGGELLLRRVVRPWLPDRPVLPVGNAPRIGVVTLLDDADAVRRLGAWKSPLALGMSPFAPHAAKSARQASWDGKGVVAVLDLTEELVEQSQALVEAGGVLLPAALAEGVDPAALLASLASSRQFLLDGSPERQPRLAEAAAEAGVPYLRVAGRLGEGEDRRVTWALTQRRKRGVVLVDATDEGLSALEEFIEASRDVGFVFVLPTELLPGVTGSESPPAP
jgi:hypothetical protein